MTNQQAPEALRLANVCSNLTRYSMDAHLIAAELRRQHARIAELEAKLSSSGFTAADMATAAAQGFRDGVASVAASATAPSAHIKEPYTLAEIKAKIASNDYGAELLLQHAMALLDSASLAESVESEPAAHVQNPAEIEHVAGDVSKNGAESNMSTQPAPATQQEAQEPVAWCVTGCDRLLDEDEAKAEARHIGGTARAMPLYTALMRSSASEYMPGLEEIEAVLLGLRILFSASRVDLPGWESWPPDAQAEDSVLEGAALLKEARDALWQPANVALCERIDAYLDAARKQGANHE